MRGFTGRFAKRQGLGAGTWSRDLERVPGPRQRAHKPALGFPAKPVSQSDETRLKQMAGYLVVKINTGTATMQFFLELILDYYCCQNLVAQPLLEDEA
jgi:hypothetical protein